MRTGRRRRIWADAGDVDPDEHARVAVPLRRRDHGAREVLLAEGAQHGRVVLGPAAGAFRTVTPGVVVKLVGHWSVAITKAQWSSYLASWHKGARQNCKIVYRLPPTLIVWQPGQAVLQHMQCRYHGQ